MTYSVTRFASRAAAIALAAAWIGGFPLPSRAAPAASPASPDVPAVAAPSAAGAPAVPSPPAVASPSPPARPVVPGAPPASAAQPGPPPPAPDVSVPSRLPLPAPPGISAAPPAKANGAGNAAPPAKANVAGSTVPSRLPSEPPPQLAAPPEEKRPDVVLSPGEVDFQVSRNQDADDEPAARDLFESLPGGEERIRPGIPEGLGSRVDKWMRYFQSGGRSRFETYLSRSGKYAKLMQDILNKYGLPGDLIYLALIESGFSPKAYSVAAAAGPWQFIAATGKRYGLKIDWWADERRDYEKSTHAAASYLKDLYGMFDSWQLATAAYNAGEGKISRAVGRYKSTDYAELIKYGYLAQETKDYVPKMLAAQTIAKEPDRYGFGGVQYQDPLEFDKVIVPGGIDLDALGEIIGVPYDSLREWNPELRRFCTPPNRESYELRVPRSYGKVVQENLDAIRREARVTFVLHTAAKGETLDSLAERYGASAANIRELNGLKGNSLRKSAKLVIPVTGLGPEDAVPGKEISADQIQMAHMRDDVRRGKRGRHAALSSGRGSSVTVRKGDTLSRVAKRAGVSVAALAKANGITAKSKVKAGTRLRIPGRGADDDVGIVIVAEDGNGKKGKKENVSVPAKERASADGEGGDPASRKSTRHIVRKGETLDKIARQHGVTVDEIVRRNKLSNGHKIRRGRVLMIPAES